MFLYPNKVVAFQISSDASLQAETKNLNIYINNNYVGDVTLDPAVAGLTGGVFIGSANENLYFSESGSFISGVADPALYYFSSLSLNEGINNVSILNIGSDSAIFEANIFNVKGGELIHEDSVFISGLTGSGDPSFSFSFELERPVPVGLSELKEFDPIFNLDTGNLNQIFSGSGVHLKKDVSFSFDFLDQQANIISTDQDYLNNPLLNASVFDIVDVTGGLIVENYFSGKFARSISISESENESIFGRYTKDFGVRVKIPNSFDNSIFTGVFIAHGNVPNIIGLTPNFSEFTGLEQVTEKLNVAISLQNDLRFTKMNRYDIYASTGAYLQLSPLAFLDPKNQEGYFSSQSASNIEDIYNLKIDKGTLSTNIPYYFTIVPYSELGSGQSIQLGPISFVEPPQASPSNQPVNAQDVSIYDGTKRALSIFKTGQVINTGLLHSFDTGEFCTAQYLIEMKAVSGVDDGKIRSANIRVAASPTAPPESRFNIIEDLINANWYYRLNYSFSSVSGNLVGLYITDESNSDQILTYKLFATII
jgi:hypothetical protein